MNLNGPVNYVRMKNKDKEIYIFSDIHRDPINQTKCDMSTLNHDFDNYLKVFLDKTKETIDFFLEIPNIQNKNYDSNQMYILNVRKLFQSLKYGDYKYPNVRFHFTDIREDSKLLQFYNVTKLKDNLYYNENITHFLDDLHHNMVFFKELIDVINIILKQKNYPIKELKETKITELNDYLMKILNKILNEKTYHSNHVYDIIRNYFGKEMFFQLLYICVNLSIIYDKSSKIEKEYLDEKKTNYDYIHEYKMQEKILFRRLINSNYPEKYKQNNDETIFTLNEITNIISDFECKIMDLYFLRRFLDKEYIKKSIMYCGDYHFVHYISFLVKYFDFEILECDKFYIVPDIKELEKKLKTEEFEDCYKYFSPDNYSQCIRLKKDLFT